ncbi:MAG: hypothetical protein JNL01_04335 [Bdellovibrionales bacterium]|nr:hypothetical protein [Bdellovibrionales bacterium]
MPGPVSGSTDGGYSMYKRSLDEVQDEYQTQKSKSENAQRIELEKQQDAHVRDMRRQEEAHNEALEHARKNANDYVENERKNYRAEIDAAKKEMYDSRGRWNSAEADHLKATLNSTREGYEAELEKLRKQADITDSNHADRVAELAALRDEEIARTLETYRNEVGEANENNRVANTEFVNQLQSDHKNRYQLLDDQRVADAEQTRRYHQKATEDLKKSFNHKLELNDKDLEERSTKINRAAMERSERAIAQQRKAHNEEAVELRRQVKDMIGEDMKAKAELGNRADNYEREKQREFDKMREMVVDDRDRTVEHERERSDEVEKALGRKKSEALADKDDAHSKTVKELTKEAYVREKVLEKEFDRNYQTVKAQAKKDAELAEKHLESAVAKEVDNKNKALNYQSKAYGDQMTRDKQQYAERIERLQKDLHQRNTSDNVADISPAAEHAIRTDILTEYEKKLGTEQERNKASVDSIQESYSSRMQEAIAEREYAETERNRHLNTEHHRERSDLLHTIQDTEENKKQSIREMEASHAREREKLVKAYSQAMERQRRQYDDLLNQTRSETGTKLQMAQRDAQMEAKLSHRAFASQNADIRREYERKLADQKADYEAKLQDQKNALETQIRNERKQTELALKDAEKNTEFREKQLEQAHKERERFLIAGYEDNIEKVKRSHAKMASRYEKA